MSQDSLIRSRIEAQHQLSLIDPISALVNGEALIGAIPHEDHASRSEVLRSLSLASRTASTVADSITYGRESAAAARAADQPELIARALMTLAGSLMLSGRNQDALRLIEEAEQIADSALLAAQVRFQRGAILLRSGDPKTAQAVYSSILPVFTTHRDHEFQRMALSNRALARRFAGDLKGARSDLQNARQLYERAGIAVEVAYTDHNLGWVALDAGDILEALRLFDASEESLMDILGSASEIQVSRCEALLSAGLFRESLNLALTIADDMQRSGLRQDEAEARLLAAQAAMLAGKIDVGLHWSDRAFQMFSEQGRTTWAAIARLVGIQIKHQAGASNEYLMTNARAAAATLEGEGHVIDAHRARLLAGSIGMRLGPDDRVVADLQSVADRRGGSIESRLQARKARAMIRLIQGDLRGADASARAGMRLLDEYQAAIGATDVRLGIEQHGLDLGNLGLSLALGSGRARRVFRWLERRRGRGLVYRPVAPPRDVGLAADLTELRQLTLELRTTRGDNASSVMRRQVRIQESIRNRARRSRRTGMAWDWVSPKSLMASLDDRTLIELGALDNRMWAVAAGGGHFRLRELGPELDIHAELESLRFTMRRLARGRGSIANASEVARRLDNLIFGPLELGEGPIIIAPTPLLHATPWWALPTCQPRPVTIAPSAELWYRAWRAVPVGTTAVLAAGPDLDLSDVEIGDLKELHAAGAVFSSTESFVEVVQTHLDGAGIVHIASHASFQYENPMFSSLRLADGDLYVYDIERLETAPGLVVLSACDSGFTETHPGEELMGLSSALLSMGTRSVIASVGLVPDSEATKHLMVGLHRGLVSGSSPSEALHRAQLEASETPEGYVAASSFICIGAG